MFSYMTTHFERRSNRLRCGVELRSVLLVGLVIDDLGIRRGDCLLRGRARVTHHAAAGGRSELIEGERLEKRDWI